MIRFSCPTCQEVLSAPLDKAGQKMYCSRCQQKLLIPKPNLDKTVPGALLSEGAAAQLKAATPAGAITAAPPREEKWFYALAGKQHGPVLWNQLVQLAASGQIKPTDLVWTKRMVKWMPALSVPNLFPSPGKGTAADPLSIPSLSLRSSRGSAQGGMSAWTMILLSLGMTVVVIGLVVAAIVSSKRGTPTATRPESTEPTRPAISAPEPIRPREPTRPVNEVLSVPELVARCDPAVARIRGRRSVGTGFLAGPNVVVTNSHVISGEPIANFRVYFPSAKEGKDRSYPAEILHQDPRRDLALLRVRVPDSYQPLPIAESYTLRKGEDIVVIGSPVATAGEDVILNNAVSKGTMSSETTINGLPFYQMGITVNPGNSGGPVLDLRGRVIGVVARKAVGDRQEGLGFAIPLSDLHEALKKARAE